MIYSTTRLASLGDGAAKGACPPTDFREEVRGYPLFIPALYAPFRNLCARILSIRLTDLCVEISSGYLMPVLRWAGISPEEVRTSDGKSVLGIGIRSLLFGAGVVVRRAGE